MKDRRKKNYSLLAVALAALVVSGCGTTQMSAPQPSHREVTLTGTRDWDTHVAPEGKSVEDVTAFAVSLGAKGRHGEAASILEDKAGSVESRRNALNIQLYLAAANEYLQAGDTTGFTRSLAQAESLADRYQRSAWDEQTRSMLSLRDRLLASN
jgi:hypothetical protein